MNRKSILFDQQPSQLSTSESSIRATTNEDSGPDQNDELCRSTVSPDIKKATEKRQNTPTFRVSDYRLISNIFIGSIMVQYILIFFAIPFSEVDNRPAASVLSCLLGYLSFSAITIFFTNKQFLLCVLMIPAGLINVPTDLSFQSSLISCMLKLIDLAANVYSLILCLRVKEPMIEYSFDSNRLPVRPLDITVYIQTISCLLFISSIVSLFFSMILFAFNFAYFQSRKTYDASSAVHISTESTTV